MTATTKTRAVNLYKEQYDVYIGRAGKGQKGVWGNPFSIGKDGNRVEVIGKYRKWISARLESEPELRAQVKALKGKRLGCFCKPQACHGDVLAALAETL